MTQTLCPAHALSHSLLQSLSDLFSQCSILLMLTPCSKTKLTPHCTPCLTKAPLPVVWGLPQGGSGGLSFSSTLQGLPTQTISCSRQLPSALWTDLTIPISVLGSLLFPPHVLPSSISVCQDPMQFFSNPAFSLKDYVIYKYHLSFPLNSLIIIFFNLSNSAYILPCVIMIFVLG